MFRKVMVTTVALGAVAVGGVLVAGYFKSPQLRVERSITIAASPETIFAHINDLKKFDIWNPWSAMDPEIKHTYSGAESGVGAVSNWSGNHNVGEGSMTILETVKPQLVRIRLQYLKPFAGENNADFTLSPEGHDTKVTWLLSGDMAYVPRLMSFVINMDEMTGSAFERGLQHLKTIAESEVPQTEGAPK